jgi:hypothetical protein
MAEGREDRRSVQDGGLDSMGERDVRPGTAAGNHATDLQSAIARHEREIADLKDQVKALQDGYAKERLEAEIDRHIQELEAEISLQELQETVARDAEAQQRKRGFFGRRKRS